MLQCELRHDSKTHAEEHRGNVALATCDRSCSLSRTVCMSESQSGKFYVGDVIFRDGGVDVPGLVAVTADLHEARNGGKVMIGTLKGVLAGTSKSE